MELSLSTIIACVVNEVSSSSWSEVSPSDPSSLLLSIVYLSQHISLWLLYSPALLHPSLFLLIHWLPYLSVFIIHLLFLVYVLRWIYWLVFLCDRRLLIAHFSSILVSSILYSFVIALLISWHEHSSVWFHNVTWERRPCFVFYWIILIILLLYFADPLSYWTYSLPSTTGRGSSRSMPVSFFITN